MHAPYNHRRSLWPRPSVGTLSDIPGGINGTRATLRTMADLIRDAKTDARIREVAVGIIAGLPHKAYAEQAEAITDWVARNVQFVRDVDGVETLTPPAYLLSTLAGDCDDQSMLVGALLQSIGLPVRLSVGGPDAARMVHVWCEVNIAGRWLACETTEPLPFGTPPRFPFYMDHRI